ERTFGLDAHHLIPRSQGGPTDKHNLAMICKINHRQAVPHGPYVLEGDPEQPDGLTWRRVDEPGQGTGDARAGPAA
ncbi:MAG: HNH endonuclease, partial [Acidimicrobiia bacterium]|nr:HNH endonuclease [Acidimicrobiia bacterium]